MPIGISAPLGVVFPYGRLGWNAWAAGKSNMEMPLGRALFCAAGRAVMDPTETK